MDRRSLFIYFHIIQQHLYSALVCDFFGVFHVSLFFFFVHMIQFQTDWTVHIAMWHGYHFTQHVDVEPARHCSSVCLTCNKKMTLNKRGCLQCNHCINFFFRSYHSCCSPYVQRVNPNFDDARHTKYPTKSGITFFPTENARHLSNFHWVSVDFGRDFIHIKITMNFQSQPCSRTRWVLQNFILQITVTLMTILEAIERSDMIFMFAFILYIV